MKKNCLGAFTKIGEKSLFMLLNFSIFFFGSYYIEGGRTSKLRFFTSPCSFFPSFYLYCSSSFTNIHPYRSSFPVSGFSNIPLRPPLRENFRKNVRWYFTPPSRNYRCLLARLLITEGSLGPEKRKQVSRHRFSSTWFAISTFFHYIARDPLPSVRV